MGYRDRGVIGKGGIEGVDFLLGEYCKLIVVMYEVSVVVVMY